MKDLAGKTAFITGGASGIGLAVARALAKARMNIALADIGEQALDAARAEIEGLGVRATATVLDVSDRAALYAAADEAEAAFGRVHVLVNNAGVGILGTPPYEMADEDLDWIVGVNLLGVLYGVKAFVPRMIAHGEGGHVVNTSSMIGFYTKPGTHHGMYALTKYAITGFSESLKDDLEPHGIGVTILAPGGVRTNLTRSADYRPGRFGGAYRETGEHPLTKVVGAGIAADVVGERTRRAIERNELYVFTEPEMRAWIEERHQRLLAAMDLADELASTAD